MIIRFSKYHGTGNDFIMIDNRSSVIRITQNSTELIAKLCHRKFGIGADGLILINTAPKADFGMVYFNSDGREGTMCGNGGRCAVAFASSLGLIHNTTVFTAVDGIHEANILGKDNDATIVKLKMSDVENIEKHNDFFVLNTGSPHYVSFRKDISKLDVFQEGKKIRYSEMFAMDGVNVNFAEAKEDGIFVRTYERGVEDETLSCGTGSTATAIAASLSGLCTENYCRLNTLGGELTVYFNKVSETVFTDIWLEGPAVCVFKGEIVL